MNILQIANKAIYPPDGGSIAILSLAKAYVSVGHRVHLLNMITHKHYNDVTIIEPEYRNQINITGIKINSKISFIKLFGNFLFSKTPYISNRFISKEFKQKLAFLLKNETFEFIQIEGLYVLQYIKYIRQHYKGKVLYRPHNLEYLIWERNILESETIFKKIYLKSLTKRLKKLEIRYLNSYDYLLPISNTDAYFFKKLGNLKPVKVSPFGIDLNTKTKHIIENDSISEPSINYIGALDWIPNQEGLKWFIDYCFPIILESFPEIKLNIAGRNAPKWLINNFNHRNIHFFGEVKNAYEFMQKSGPIIVPLFSGSGMRVKIIESMSLQKAIVATSIAAEGINCLHNENIMIADNPENFANSVVILIKNLDLQKQIGDNAYKLIKEQFDMNKIANSILNFIK